MSRARAFSDYLGPVDHLLPDCQKLKVALSAPVWLWKSLRMSPWYSTPRVHRPLRCRVRPAPRAAASAAGRALALAKVTPASVPVMAIGPLV